MRLPLATGGERVAATLEALGLRCVISIPGSQTLPIWDALPRRPALRLVVPRTERNGALMAEGYGLVARFPAVLLSTLGPGVANELVGLRSAAASGAPLLCISPAQPPNKLARIRDVFQGLDHGRFLGGVCKASLRIEPDGRGLEQTLERALAACLEPPPGPARLDIAFPALFQRRLRAARRVRPAPRPAPPAGPVVVRDPSVPEPRLRQELARLPGPARVLTPGLALPGGGLPLALGARLACEDAVTVVIADDRLLEQMDSLAVARLHDVPLCVVGEPHRRLAGLFGARVADEPEPRPGELTVVAVGTG